MTKMVRVCDCCGREVNVLQEDYYSFYGGPWTRVEWNGNWYWVKANKLKKLDFKSL